MIEATEPLTSKSSAGPDFIGIGARRCASSRIHQLLNAHPAVLKPQRGTHFFSSGQDIGIDAYLGSFPVADENAARVDFSVSYLYPEFADSAASAIARYRPEAKLFATLRDPVARSYSDYTRSIMLAEIDASTDFISACEAHPEFIERSRYIKLLTPYWDHFGQDSVKLFAYEDLRSDQQTYYEELASFFGVNVAPFLEPVKGETGHAHAVKSPGLQKIVLGSKSALRRGAVAIGANDVWTGVTRALQPVYQKILRVNGRELKITEREIAYVKNKLGDDTTEFINVVKLPTLRKWEQ